MKSKKNLNIGILGLAYKANTSSIKNSPSIELINSIKSEKIFVYDPVVKKINLKKNLFVSNNIYQVLNVSNILFIMTPWNIFKKININQIYKSKIKIIVDPYALLVKYKNLFYKKKIEYHSLI